MLTDETAGQARHYYFIVERRHLKNAMRDSRLFCEATRNKRVQTSITIGHASLILHVLVGDQEFF